MRIVPGVDDDESNPDNPGFGDDPKMDTSGFGVLGSNDEILGLSLFDSNTGNSGDSKLMFAEKSGDIGRGPGVDEK